MVQMTATAAPTTDKQIKKLVKAIRRHRKFIEGHEAKNDAMKGELQALLEASGENWADEFGYARLIPASTRTSYDIKALDELILRDPAFECLRVYCRKTEIRSSVAVK